MFFVFVFFPQGQKHFEQHGLMSFCAAEPRVDHLSSKQHTILYKQPVTEGWVWKSAGSSVLVLRGRNDREKVNVWNKDFISILQELLSSK